MHQLLIQLLVATATVIVTVLMHGYGLAILVRLLGLLKINMSGALDGRHHFVFRTTIPVLCVVLALFAIHGVEIWFYALVYLALGAIPALEQAVYFSTMTYATIGYSDTLILREWRVLAAIEGINGIILLGWSTAFFITVINRIRG